MYTYILGKNLIVMEDSPFVDVLSVEPSEPFGTSSSPKIKNLQNAPFFPWVLGSILVPKDSESSQKYDTKIPECYRDISSGWSVDPVCLFLASHYRQTIGKPPETDWKLLHWRNRQNAPTTNGKHPSGKTSLERLWRNKSTLFDERDTSWLHFGVPIVGY